MQQPRPFLISHSADTVAELVEWYEKNIDNLIAELSHKYGHPVGVAPINIYKEAMVEAGGYMTMVIMFIKHDQQQDDEAKDLMMELMEGQKKFLEKMQGGDTNCQHKFESTEKGLVCTKCGGTL